MDPTVIEQWPLVRFIATAPGAYPVLSALHILGIALLVGPILLVDLRMIGVLRSPGSRQPSCRWRARRRSGSGWRC